MAKTFQFDFVINGLVNRNFGGAMSSAHRGLVNIGKESQELKSKLRQLDKELYAGQIDFEGYAAKANKAKAQLKALELQQMKLNKAIAARQHLKSAAMEFSGLALGVYAASRPIVGMINVAAEFEETMSRVKAITRANADEMNLLTEEAKRLGRETPFTAKQSAEAMTYLGMAGWETSQILKGMPGLLKLAMAGKTDLARTADIISDDLTAFGLGAEQAQHMADVFAYTITRTNTNVEMLGETMKYAAPVAHAFGASMEETAALAGMMANGAIKASTAGTALRMGFLRLAGPPKKAAKALDELGISMSDATKEHAEAQAAIKSLGIDMNTAEGQARPMIGIVKELREKLNQLGKQERLDLAQKIFGVHASSAWLNVFDAPAEKFAQLVGEMEKCDGAADEFAKTATNNARGALTRLQSATEGVALAIGSVFLPALADAAGGAAHYAGIIGDAAEKHPVLIKTIGAVGVAMAGTALAVKAAGVIYAAYQVAATAATAGTWAFNAALLANPIGLVVVGIAGLVAAGYTLYKNWDTVSASLVKGWTWVKDTAQGVYDWFMSTLSQLPEKAGFAVGYVIGWYMQLPGKLMGVIGSLDGVGQAFIGKAKEWGKLGLNGIIDAFLELPGKLTSLVSNAWESAKNAVGSFTVGISQGMAAGEGNGTVAANAKGGIYSKGAFLTTFAEESPEAAIPIDHSERAKQLWLKTGQMLGLLQHPERNRGTATPSFAVQGIGPDVSPAQTEPEHHGQQVFIHGQMKTPGVFGILQKWIQHPGTNEGKTVSFPVIPKQPAPIVNTMAKLSGLAQMIGRAISVAALALSPMAAAASPAINPAIVNAAANVMAAPPGVAVTSPAVTPIINATAAAPTVDVAYPEAPIVNAMANTPDVAVTSPTVMPVINATASTPIIDVASPAVPVVNAMAAVPDVYVGQEAPNILPIINIPAYPEPKKLLPNIPEDKKKFLINPEINVAQVAAAARGNGTPEQFTLPPFPEIKAPAVNIMLPGIFGTLLSKIAGQEKAASIAQSAAVVQHPETTERIMQLVNVPAQPAATIKAPQTPASSKPANNMQIVVPDSKAPAITLPSFPELPAPIVNIGKALTEKTVPVMNTPILQVLHEVLQHKVEKNETAAPLTTSWPIRQQPEPVGTIARMMQAAPPVPAGIVTATLPGTLPPATVMTDNRSADGAGTETGKPGLPNMFTALTAAFQHSAAFQNSGVISQPPSMPALQNVGVVQPPELNQPADGPDLLRRIREFVQNPGDNISNSHYNITYAPTIAPKIEIAGTNGRQEVMEAVEQASDISFEKFRQMMQKYEHEHRRSSYT